MNIKNIFYSLISIPILFSCTSTYEQPPSKYSITYDGNESNCNWITVNQDDPFEGKWIRSYVNGESSKGYYTPRLIVDYYPETQGYSVGINWGEMICSSYIYEHNLQYVADGLPPFSISYLGYYVADNQDNLIWFRNNRGVEMENHLLYMLNNTDEILFQIQSCGGNRSRVTFDVTGQHHLTTLYLE